MALSVGERLGHYDLTALIGAGGMGQVYRATDTRIDGDARLATARGATTASVTARL